MPPRRPGPPPHRPRPPGQRSPTPRNRGRGTTLLAVVLVAVAVVAGAWYFLLRPSSTPSTTFVTASERFTASVRGSLDAEQHVQRFLELSNFDATVHASLVEMRREIVVFQRLARTESGKAATIARATTTAGVQAVNAMYAFEVAVIDSHLVEAEAARARLSGFITTINAQAERWKKLG